MIVPNALLAQEEFTASNPAASPTSSLEATPRRLLTEVNALAVRLRQRGRSAAGGHSDIPGAEQAVLEIIERMGAFTVPQIAQQRSTSRQNIQILVDRLAAKGCVELLKNPSHKRSALVHLTQKGKLSLLTSDQGQKQLLSRIGCSLSKVEISATIVVLRRIRGLLSEDLEEPNTSAGVVQSNNETRPSRVAPVPHGNLAAEEFPVNLL